MRAIPVPVFQCVGMVSGMRRKQGGEGRWTPGKVYGTVSLRKSAYGTRDRSSSICVKATVWRCISR
ncbi:hypothetical protein CLU94_5465 [Janthinobacterium sp. 13]|nr:hypothetical protein CLU94_5465 [Janthinobacterium sp. 13]